MTGETTWLREILEARTGIVLEPDKEYLVEARLQPLVTRERSGTLTELVRRSRTDGLLMQRLIEALTNNETSFFRDVVPFRSLRTAVFPALQARGDRVRIWSAACSTGQEAYSVAMLLRDEFPLLASRAEIVGTDVNAHVVARARAATYTPNEVARGLQREELGRHFVHRGGLWVVRPALRAMTRFQVLNLLDPWPAGPAFDLVLLRNVLIYFALQTRNRVLRRVHLRMRPDGWLMLGSSETLVPPDLFGAEGSLFRPR